MIDFYYQLRQRMVETMQISLKQIRQVLGFGVQEFGDLMGLTRQTINNLEMKKNKMSAIQYVAVCAVIDNCTKDKPELFTIVSTILCSNEDEQETSIFETISNGSLLKKWFLCFPDEAKIIGFSQNESSLTITNEDFDNIAECYRVFLDQTALFEKGFSEAIQSLNLSMKNSGNKYIIPLKVIESIQHQMMSVVDEGIKLAQNGMNLLMNMQNQDLVEIRGEKSDVNILSTFVSVFAKFKCVNRLALITQNPKLAKQISALNNDDIGGFNILVLKYSKDKGIHRWVENDTIVNDNIVLESDDEANSTEEDSSNLLRGWGTID